MFSFKNLKIIISIVTLLPQISYAAGLSYTEWESNLHLGIGGAGVASGDDVESLFSNPALTAGLRSLRSSQILQSFQLPLPNSISFNQISLNEVYKSSQSDILKSFLASKAQTSETKQSYVATQMFPYIMLGYKLFPTLVIGFPIRSEHKLALLDPATPTNIYYHGVTTYTSLFHLSFSTGLGALQGGFNFRPNYREEYYTTSLNSDKVTFSGLYGLGHDQATVSYGTNMDAGFTVGVYDYWFPTFGVSVINIPTGCQDNYYNLYTQKSEKICGSVRYLGRNDPNGISKKFASQIDPTEVHAGGSITPRLKILRFNIRLRLAADVYPIPIAIGDSKYGVSSDSVFDMLHAGARLFFGNSAFGLGPYASVGAMNSAMTWGGGIRYKVFNLEYASFIHKDFVEDIGQQSYLPISERRHLLSLKFIF